MTDKMRETILPCPFCGGEDIHVLTTGFKKESQGYLMSCGTDKCPASNMNVDDEFCTAVVDWDSEEEAISAWNKRAWQAAQSYCPSPDPVKLAELGWQMIECPICGGGARAFPQQAKQSEQSVPAAIMDSRCTYYSFAGSVCNKCGQIHDGGKSVPVVGEVVAWKADNGQWSPSKKDAEVYTRRMGKVMHPLVVQPTHFVSTAELERLRKDAERLQYMLDEAAIIMCAVGTTSTMYRLEWPLTGYVQTDFHKSEREAIDAAIAAEEKER